ncbi:hypothetical protein PMIN07_007973 [Paraphaeosphaeria minitans]
MSGEPEASEAQKPVVTFLGPVASYTHQATLSAFPNSTHTLTPTITIEDVFASVQSGTAARGVVPFENSSNGSVVFTLDLFADVRAKYPDIVVCAESYVAVQHCLLGHAESRSDHQDATPSSVGGAASRTGTGVIPSPLSSGTATPTPSLPRPTKPTARPLSDLSRITKLYSHPQAWGQCKVFLDTYLKGVERQDVSSTSRAAQMAAEDGSGQSAAVSSAFAAEVCGLGVLARGIEDAADNTTRFFVIKRRGGEDEDDDDDGDDDDDDDGDDDDDADLKAAGEPEWKSLVSFTVDHANPGSLAHSLAVFETHALNLTSINTRPSGEENWKYIFFVEFKGRRRDAATRGGGPVDEALRELDAVCRSWRWLGSWESRLPRR